ncbi:CidA/LrgA family protein [uncultured Neptuniibacter sp.]|uniref:CidA/LrgA family protein n=1 Tax=uncultured Neptuniibacter sp. TaxID=502143 RepID=UPI0026161846|nr:CidA/LrgA family protein [uncultured Neptuniibacter sp.]
MVQGFLILLACQLCGELTVTLLNVPVPGSVVGMVLLLIGLMIRGEVPDGLRTTGEGLLRLLPLLLVPAGVGLMTHFALLSEYWGELIISLFVSTLITMFTVALLLKLLSKEKVAVEHEGGGVDD